MLSDQPHRARPLLIFGILLVIVAGSLRARAERRLNGTP
jgi:hypothetical protein